MVKFYRNKPQPHKNEERSNERKKEKNGHKNKTHQQLFSNKQ